MVHLDLLTRLRQELRFTLATVEEGTLAVAERVNRKVQLMRLHWQASQIQAALSRVQRHLGEAVSRQAFETGLSSETRRSPSVIEEVLQQSLPQVQSYKEQLERIHVQVGVLRSEFVHDDLVRYYRDIQVRAETFAYVPVVRGSSCVGLSFETLALRYGVRVLMVVRGAVLLNPTDRSMLRAGDQVALVGRAEALTSCVAHLTASRATERLA
jgi:K+/H+ antiporter YhaU regulatory subunit KhtT